MDPNIQITPGQKYVLMMNSEGLDTLDGAMINMLSNKPFPHRTESLYIGFNSDNSDIVERKKEVIVEGKEAVRFHEFAFRNRNRKPIIVGMQELILKDREVFYSPSSKLYFRYAPNIEQELTGVGL